MTAVSPASMAGLPGSWTSVLVVPPVLRSWARLGSAVLTIIEAGKTAVARDQVALAGGRALVHDVVTAGVLGHRHAIDDDVVAGVVGHDRVGQEEGGAGLRCRGPRRRWRR